MEALHEYLDSHSAIENDTSGFKLSANNHWLLLACSAKLRILLVLAMTLCIVPRAYSQNLFWTNPLKLALEPSRCRCNTDC